MTKNDQPVEEQIRSYVRAADALHAATGDLTLRARVRLQKAREAFSQAREPLRDRAIAKEVP